MICAVIPISQIKKPRPRWGKRSKQIIGYNTPNGPPGLTLLPVFTNEEEDHTTACGRAGDQAGLLTPLSTFLLLHHGSHVCTLR